MKTYKKKLVVKKLQIKDTINRVDVSQPIDLDELVRRSVKKKVVKKKKTKTV